MTEQQQNFKSKRSLSTILMFWFVLFAAVPLFFIVGYSLKKFEEGLDHELSERLSGNLREIAVIIRDDFEKRMDHFGEKTAESSNVIFYMSSNADARMREIGQKLLKTHFVQRLSFFNSEGRRMAALYKMEGNEVQASDGPAGQAWYLSDELMRRLRSEKIVKDFEFVPADPGNSDADAPKTLSLELITYSQVRSRTGQIIGWIEQALVMDRAFLRRLKSRMDVELFLIDKDWSKILASHPDIELYQRDFFARQGQKEAWPFFSFSIQDEPFGFHVHSIHWGDAEFYTGLGASKKELVQIRQRVQNAFISIVTVIIILLIVASLILSRYIVRPLHNLVSAFHTIGHDSNPKEIPANGETELGLLTENFNYMARRVNEAQQDLRAKVSELETANQELKETQAMLVHSTKMASLGQLVAGVAHELNNPIGFIYSNMAHLREYSEKLAHLIAVAEKNPKQLLEEKKRVEFDYIMQDLPKLIKSCEEGARRTRDIVIGLRNFSRLEEAKLESFRVEDCIQQVLNLMTGEIKNRIRVHTNFKEAHSITGYPSQLSQVFVNIITNAAQAIENEGDIWIEVNHAKLHNKPSIKIKIRDNGKGMSKQVLEKIFDPFFTTKAVGQGTGLGMSISYGIVEQHGGEISVQSDLGKGSEFIINLPITAPSKV